MKTVIIDSDAIIALLYEDDSNYKIAVATLEKLIDQGYRIIFPATTIVEVVTTFQRKFSRIDLAVAVIKMIDDANLPVYEVNDSIMSRAFKVFDPKSSKQNTLFDAVVFVIAQDVKANGIFSFDKWYSKKGVSLATDLF